MRRIWITTMAAGLSLALVCALEVAVAQTANPAANDSANASTRSGARKPNSPTHTNAPSLHKASVNRFNRLLKPPPQSNPSPMSDGIHDPVSSGTPLLQAPREAFEELPKSKSGNRVDWVKALDEGKIEPRYDRLDPEAKGTVFDFDVVREVKGSMPDVVYPHKQHTQWLDCLNCHPSIFIPQRGANKISMASIMMGQHCGVCHGKVAFPISECRKCHSRDKPETSEP